MRKPRGQIIQEGQTLLWTCEGHPSVRLYGESGRVLKDKALPALMHAFTQGFNVYEAAARQRLVERYYDLWLEAWSHGFDGSLTREEFADHLSEPMISYPDGQYLKYFCIDYDPGSLFCDHGLYVTIAPDGTIINDGMM